jgi:hypothetical protein
MLRCYLPGLVANSAIELNAMQIEISAADILRVLRNDEEQGFICSFNSIIVVKLVYL